MSLRCVYIPIYLMCSRVTPDSTSLLSIEIDFYLDGNDISFEGLIAIVQSIICGLIHLLASFFSNNASISLQAVMLQV